MADRPEVLTTAEAAKLLRVRESTLRTWTQQGRVPHIRLGRLIRYDRADLEAWIATCKQPVEGV